MARDLFEEAGVDPKSGPRDLLAEAGIAMPRHSLLDQTGLAASAVFRGITSFPLAVADMLDTPASVAAKLTRQPYQSPSEEIKALGDKALSKLGLRLEQPETKGERLMQDAVTGVFSTLGGPAKNAASMVRNAIAGGTGGYASGSARESGAGPLGQIVAGMAGGMTPAFLEGTARSIGGVLGNAGAAVGAAYGNQRAINRLAAQAIQTEAGSPAERARIAAAGMAATEYVPGAKPTVAQAIAEAQMGAPEQFGGGIVGLEKSLSGARGLEDILPTVAKRQQFALNEPLQLMAGGSTRQAQDSAQSMAKASRAADAGARYEAIAPTITRLDNDLIRLLSSPAGQKAYEMARTIAKNDAAVRAKNGLSAIPFEVTNEVGKVTGHSAQGLQYIKEALDSMSGDKLLQAQMGLSGSALVPIKGIRSGLIDWMNVKIPGWQDARNAYAKQSDPLNRLRVGQALSDKLRNEQGNLTAASFLNSVGRGEDSFLKRATGDPRPVNMLPQEEQHIKGVGQHLAREAEVKRIDSAVNNIGSGNLAANEIAKIPNLLNRTAMVVNFMLKHVGGGANIPVAKEMAKRLSDPASFNELLLRPADDPMRRLAEALASTSLGVVSEQQNAQQPIPTQKPNPNENRLQQVMGYQ